MAAITISYVLHPPTDSKSLPADSGRSEQSSDYPSGLTASRAYSFPVVIAASSNNTTAYYSSLRQTLLEAKNIAGKELTEWKDVVGNRELWRAAADDEDDDEEESS
ncbi:hypothetical protein PUNSTDRAFT_140620 [Punctularia strigosozonata HHB-11173 SS5]|uniref:uncharacterized protein n=1 Tax=Punctularia strigosozonata (strain HHB-11173) TaxID=741275 RepID=UPI0004417BA9|nr:uncharacterized protein PUNSTDRAFT_140620 [Punctularia strigosozonata HHB-11173 SS5]EIN14295.1 hypothetical protein PUNSTDRAFT_140620 [Punctularia strigosozonata HHB-11173 SS5]